jgi:hypothetical protein
MQFDKLVEQLLTEMPYIEVSNQIFDLEMEKYKGKPEKFVQKLQSILQGDSYTDKYGNTIQLTTPEEKELFRKKIKLNLMIKGFMPGDLVDSL